MTRERVRAPGHDRNRSLGHLALKWIEFFCVHGPGDVEGIPLIDLPLDDEFAGLIVDCYALGDDGRRLYDSAFLSRAKGRAKSEWAALNVLFEAFGPCRFDGWAEGGEVYEWRDLTHTYEPGEPMGRPVTYPFIRCLATEETQAGNTYDNIYFNLTQGLLADGLPSTAAGLTRIILPHGGWIVPSTSSNAAKDGGKETFVVFDETHLYVKPELKKMYNTVRRNMAKRKDAEPWSLETSTMYLPGESSVAEDTHKLAKLIRDDKTKRSRLLFDHRQAPDDVNLEDEEQLLAALKEAYGDFAAVMDLRRIVDEIWDPRNSSGDSRRYFLNQPTSSVDSYIPANEWAGCLDTERKIEPGDLITLGFDGSRGMKARGKPDATGLIATRVEDGHQEKWGHWECDNEFDYETWTPPLVEVDAAIDRAFTEYQVGAFFADPAGGWESQVNVWEATYGPKLVKVPGSTRQVRPSGSSDHPFCWWFNRTELTQRAIEAYRDAVTNKEMTHGQDQAFTAHVLNARLRVQRQKLVVKKENDYSPKKVDLCVAAFLSWQARLGCIAAGIKKTPERRAPVRIR